MDLYNVKAANFKTPMDFFVVKPSIWSFFRIQNHINFNQATKKESNTKVFVSIYDVMLKCLI